MSKSCHIQPGATTLKIFPKGTRPSFQGHVRMMTFSSFPAKVIISEEINVVPLSLSLFL